MQLCAVPNTNICFKVPQIFATSQLAIENIEKQINFAQINKEW